MPPRPPSMKPAYDAAATVTTCPSGHDAKQIASPSANKNPRPLVTING